MLDWPWPFAICIFIRPGDHPPADKFKGRVKREEGRSVVSPAATDRYSSLLSLFCAALQNNHLSVTAR
jgi:hypothetical protein